MSTNKNLVLRRGQIALAVAAACVSGAALAQPLLQVPLYGNADMTPYATNNLEVGVLYNTTDSYKFGQWTGLTDKGAYANVNGNFGGLNAGNASYWNLWGWNLGLDSRQLGADVGKQGSWRAYGEFDQLSNAISNEARSPYINPGSRDLLLVPGYPTGSANANPLAANARFMLPYEVKVDRDFYKAGGSFDFLRAWQGYVDVNYQTMNGTRLGGLNAGNSGYLAPTPIDGTQNQLTAGFRYSGETLQADVNYYLSTYSNKVTGDGYTFQQAGTPSTVQVVSLQPDNDYSQVSGTFAWAFMPATQLTGTASYGWGKQDSDYVVSPWNTVPGTGITPATATVPATPIVRLTNLDAETSQTLVDLTLTSRPWADVGLRANYHYLDRSNDSPQNRYATSQTGTAIGTNVRFNMVPDYTLNRLVLEGDYRLAKQAKLRGWYQYQKTEYAEANQFMRADQTINSYGAELLSRGNALVGGSLKYVFSKATGAEYTSRGVPPYPLTGSPTSPETTVQLNDTPSLRQYWVADYNQNLLKGTLSFNPIEAFALQFVADVASRQYQGPACGGTYDSAIAPGISPQCLGLTSSKKQAYTLDGQFTPGQDWSMFAFVSFSSLQQSQWGNTATNGLPAGLWNTDGKNNFTSLGLGGQYKPQGGKFSTGIQYVYNKGTETYALNSPLRPFPDNDYRQNSVQVWGAWQFSPTLALKGNYWYQSYQGSDWNVGYTPWAAGGSPWLTGIGQPNYNTNVFGVSMVWKTW